MNTVPVWPPQLHQFVGFSRACVLNDLAPTGDVKTFVQERYAASEKEKSGLREQVQALEREAQISRAAAARADAAAVQERLFSAQKDWFTQQLQPLLQQHRVATEAATQAQAPERTRGPSGGAALDTMAPADGPAAASPAPLSSAALLSEEDGDAAAGAAAYADVGRLAQALSGLDEQAKGTQPQEEQVHGSPKAQKEESEAPKAAPPEQRTKRRGRAAAGKKTADGSTAASGAKPAKRKATAKTAARAAKSGKGCKGASNEVQPAAESQDGVSAHNSAPFPQPGQPSRVGADAAEAVNKDAPANEEPPQPVGGDIASGEPGVDGTVRAPGAGRVLRARKPGLRMAEESSAASDSGASDGASEAAVRDDGQPVKRRRSNGVKQVDGVRAQAPPAGDMPRDVTAAASPLLAAPSFGSPQAMRVEGAQGLTQGMLAEGDAAAIPHARPAATWQDPDSAEEREPALARAPLTQRPCAGSEQNVLAGRTASRGALGVHSVVGVQARRGGSQVPEPRHPETFGIVRNPMAAMTSKVMEATKLSRQKTALSWGEKLALKTSER